MALVMATFSFFWNAVLPQLEAVTLTHLGAHPQYYASIRVWGSIGFVVTAVGLGPWFDHHGTALLPLALLVLFAGIWGSTLLVPECAPPGDGGGSTPIGRVLRQPQVLAFLSVCFLMQASHAPYYTFYTLYLEAHGYSKGLIGTLWGLGVLAEIALFLGMHRLLPRAGTRDVLLASLALAALRWLIIGTLPENLPLLVLAQILHAASFGTYHAAAIHLVHRLFVGSHQGRGQALYSSIGFGAGGAAGSLISGYLWVAPGPALTYAWAAGTALLALGIAWLGLRTMK
jgi:PPP family 3-phenylpropionic acid transporter